jgi:cysteine desulfurase
MIYLDHNATTPLDPRVAEAMSECYAAGYFNPASAHAAGRKARDAIEQARNRIAELLGADVSRLNSAELIFTSGGTESNNLALRGLVGSPPNQTELSPPRVIVSAIEHPSVMGTARQLHSEGYDVRLLPVDTNGVIRLGKLTGLFNARTRLVSVMLANHETGVLQPVAELARICHEHGVLLHTDAVQVVGKLPVSFDELGVDALTLSAHKFHGPRGIGALIVRGGVRLRPILFGGFQQQGLRPGTEPVVLAMGLMRALEVWHDEADERAEQMATLRDRLESLLRTACPEAIVNGGSAARLPHCTNISFPGVDRQALLLALDQAGICCSTGSACASGSSEPSPVLMAMKCSESVIESSLRISLGATTSPMEIDKAAQIILQTVAKFRHYRASDSDPSATREST